MKMDEVGLHQWDCCVRELRRRGAARRIGNATYDMRQLFSSVDFRGTKVLDIGGGAGVASFYAACMGAESVLCLEPGASGSTASALRVPKLDSNRDRLDRVKFSTMTLQEYLAGTTSHFDVVISLASINHLDEPACVAMNTPAGEETYLRLLKRVRGVMNPAGQFVVMDCFRLNALELMGVPNPFRKAIEWQKHWQPSRWVELIEPCGFEMESVRYLSLNTLRQPGSWLMNNWVAAFLFSGDFRIHFRAC